MFDVSFSELFVIAVVALLVIGPEKLPKVARTMGAFMGRMQRYVAQVKEEVNREVRFEELQKLQQEIKQSVESTVVNKVVKPIEQEATALRGSIHEASSLAKTKVEVIEPEIKAKTVAKKRVTASPAKPKTTKQIVTKRATKPAVSAVKLPQKSNDSSIK